jgi:xanthine dehydrogenase molybdopterin-binding subunit B
VFDLQIEGAFVQGLGFFVTEGVETEDGRELADGTWDYKVPTVDTISKRFHVELFNSPALQERVLSSKGKMPLVCVRSSFRMIRSETCIFYTANSLSQYIYHTISQRTVMFTDERN